ncbi:MAG TPA: hypothetical protein VFM18_01255, partial [Methanosarcina sp.]|nr:hypothetical protein [Methanosarcina sp.]
EVAAEKAAKEARYIQCLRNYIELNGSEVLRADWILYEGAAADGLYDQIRRNLPRLMNKLGWEKVLNPNSKDGKFRIEGRLATLYKKSGKKINSDEAIELVK